MKKKTLYSILGIAVLSVLFYGLNYFLIKPQSIKKQMKLVAVNLNKKCPIIIDHIAILDSVGTITHKNFIYYQTLYTLKKQDINQDSVNLYIRPKLIKKIKKNPNYKAFRNNKIIIDYVFYDKNGLFVNKLSFTPEMYGK